MFLEWLSREGWMLPTWWLLVTLAGVAAFPLASRLLGGLPDKGYTLSRTLGMLLIAFVYWLLASYGFIENSTGGMIFAWLIVLSVGLLLYFNTGERINWREYWQENRRVIIVAEILFILFFMTMFVYRAYQNDTFTTEKPMEMNFISGIMRSEAFPPNDPWMAGYSISYYYFGYVMTAMLTMLSGLHSGFGFSMMIALIFALTGLTVFGVGYNLARSRAFVWGTNRLAGSHAKTPALIAGILATLFVLVMGNFQMPLVEMPYRSQAAPASYFEWWGMQSFTDMGSANYVQETGAFPISTPLDNPQSWGRDWWWWHTSRILTDYNFDGTLATVQPIDEVPAFSFILMDLHPHVLSLPFVVLAIGMAINIVLLKRDPNRYEIILYGLMVGGLVFLNTWDGPMFLVIIAGAEALRRLMKRDGSLSADDWLAIIGFGATLGMIALVAYLPFLIGFRSQAGGFIPNLMTPTEFRHYFLMFGPLLLLSGGFLIGEVWQGFNRKRLNFRVGFIGAGGIFFVLLLLMGVFILLGALLPESRSFVSQFIANNGGADVVLPEMLSRQLKTLLLPVLLIAGLIAIVARLFPARNGDSDDEGDTVTYFPATGVTLLLIAAAFGVTLVPEFVYLRDNFGTRINTIFKFYYQAWIILGIASSYAVYAVLFAPQSGRGTIAPRIGYGLVLAFVLISCVPFLPFGMYTRAILEQQRHTIPVESQAILSLDGRGDSISGDYFAAVQCLGNLVQGDDVIIAEASERTYNSQYGRAGAFYGLPTVINWENHERQWRGSTYANVAGSRRVDIDRMYSDLRWDIALAVIEQYDIDYIMYGPTERTQHGEAGENKFLENLGRICEFGQAQVYVVGEN